MGYGGPISPRIQLMGKSIEGKGVLAEERNIKHRFWIWEVKASEIGVKTCFRRSKIWDTCRSADSGTGLSVSAWIEPAISFA